MAKKLFESKDRAAAHAFQTKAIAEGTAPLACCTDHVARGDSTVVWDETPSAEDLEALAATPEVQ